MSNKKETIKRLIIFLVFAFALSSIPMLIYYFCAKTTDSPLYQFLGLITMFSPAAANILTRLITKEGFHHMGLRLHLKGHIKLYVLALLLPLIYTTIGGILGAACYGGFLQWEGFEEISVGYIITYIIYLIGFSVALCFYTMGEEFGWRGYMTPKLEQFMALRHL